MSAITAKTSRKMKKYAVLTREPRCFLGSFDFSWEQRKLGEMMNVTSVKRIHQSDWTDSGVRFLRARDIVAAAKNEEPDDYLYISKEKYEEYSALSGKVGVSDLLVTGVGTIGVPYLVRNLEPLYFKDGNIIWFQNSGKIDGKFLFYSFSAEQIQGFINESAGIGTVGTYTIESGKKTPISLPNQIEQARVGEFFQQLDNLITLHQRKYAFLFRRFRAAISKKLATSTFSWEQRKVQGVADRFDNLRIPVAANLRVHGTTPYYGANGIQDYVEGFTHDGEFVLVAEDGANDLKNYPVKCVNGRIWVNNHAHVLQGKAGIADNSFLAFAISQSDIESLLVGGGRAKLNAETLMSIEFRLPCLQEQYRIGEYLTQLNHLITLHQRERISFSGRASRLIPPINKKRITSSWEQRKLGDVVQITMGQSPDGSTYSDEPSDYILVQGNADLQNGWVCPRIWTTQITKKADAGDLIMSVRAPAGAMGKTAYNAVIGRGVAAIKGNEFIYQLLVKMDADGFWKTLSCGSTFESLNSDNITNAEVKIPTTAEQIKIGDYFQQLDNLITLHQRKPFLMKWRTSDANRNQTNRLVL